ncbi:hypothetical protein PLESTM_001336700 [Pleodorina starrii]|nr:hypothetical protein PLESTM_001336700 [Pleodorina starrii]
MLCMLRWLGGGGARAAAAVRTPKSQCSELQPIPQTDPPLKSSQPPIPRPPKLPHASFGGVLASSADTTVRSLSASREGGREALHLMTSRTMSGVNEGRLVPSPAAHAHATSQLRPLRDRR